MRPEPLSQALEGTLRAMSTTELMTLYQYTIGGLAAVPQEGSLEDLEGWGFVKSTLHLWKKRRLTLLGSKALLLIAEPEDPRPRSLDLAAWLPRISKNTDKHALCLHNYLEGSKVSIGFNEYENCMTFFNLLYAVCLHHWLLFLHGCAPARSVTVSHADRIKGLFRKKDKAREPVLRVLKQ
jgi:hypothetical protein